MNPATPISSVTPTKLNLPIRPFALTCGVVIVIDQISKYLALAAGRAVVNTGVSFALFADHATSVLLALAVLAIIVAFWSLKSFWNAHPYLAGLFFGGGVSNVLDRVFRAGVVDWLWLPLINVRNNLADWALCAAAVHGMMLIWKQSSIPKK